MWADAQHDSRPAEYRWRPLFNAAKFGFRPVLECRAVMLSRRETSWNLLGCPKVANGSQPLVRRSSPYCEDVWGDILLFNKYFSDCRKQFNACRDWWTWLETWRERLAIWLELARKDLRISLCETAARCMLRESTQMGSCHKLSVNAVNSRTWTKRCTRTHQQTLKVDSEHSTRREDDA